MPRPGPIGSGVDDQENSSDQCNVDIGKDRPPRVPVDKLRRIGKDGPVQRKFRVLVVDDSLVPRTAARAMLATTQELRFIGEASSGAQALAAVEQLRPDLILMDVHMPLMDGPTTAKALLGRFPATKIVAWTVSESSDDLVRMMRAGCAGYVLKDAGPTELRHALLAAMRSESPVPRKMIPEVLRRVAEQTPISRTRDISLSSREMQILRAIAKGHTTKRIAQDVRLAIPSVESHLQNIFRKLGAANRGEAVSTALKLGLITLADL
jgi:DNA-binding NarL/FixJ family response regulator